MRGFPVGIGRARQSTEEPMTSSNYPDNPEVAGLGRPPVADGSTASTNSSSSDGSGESAKDRVKQGAGTAADEGRHVAGVAQGEAQRVAAEAKSQAHGLWQQATSQID